MNEHTNNHTGTRIYAQMKPNRTDTIRAIQRALPSQRQGRVIGPQELHLTLIHFGKSDEVYRKLTDITDISRETFDNHLALYIAETTAQLPSRPIKLTFETYDLFGPKRTALVAKFIPNEALTSLHARLLGTLVEFFQRVGIAEPLTFMEQDGNFKHALSCLPHVTLYKGYGGEMPTQSIPAMCFESMNVVYT